MQFSGMNQIVGFINQYQYFGKIWDTLAVYAHIYVICMHTFFGYNS